MNNEIRNRKSKLHCVYMQSFARSKTVYLNANTCNYYRIISLICHTIKYLTNYTQWAMLKTWGNCQFVFRSGFGSWEALLAINTVFYYRSVLTKEKVSWITKKLLIEYNTNSWWKFLKEIKRTLMIFYFCFNQTPWVICIRNTYYLRMIKNRYWKQTVEIKLQKLTARKYGN